MDSSATDALAGKSFRQMIVGIIECVKAASDREIPEMPLELALAERSGRRSSR